MQKKRIVFTDLDGTLLDEKYSFKKTRPALKIIKELDIPLIICSSKTRAEIEVYRKKLGNEHAFISENGGAIFIPLNFFHKKNHEKYKIIKLGKTYKNLIKIFKKIKTQIPVKGFSDMTSEELSKNSGLNLKEAKLSKKREYDEAFILENKKYEKKLLKLIKKYQLNYTKGGKYYHILGDNNKGKAVKILSKLYKNKYKKILTISLGDAKNDLPMLKSTNKSFLVKGPSEWNKTIIKLLKINNKEIKKAEELYRESVNILKKLQLKNGAILASFPKARYPYIYPRDHAVCILALIEAGLFNEAKKALDFVLKSQNKNGSFPQRLDKKGKDASYKPIQLDNTGLILYAFARYILESDDNIFLKNNQKKIIRAIKYIKSQLNKKNLFFTPNSIHEFPPYEGGLEVWANATCYGALKELEFIGIKNKIDLNKIKKSINKYLWNGKYFIKNIRLKESSSVVIDIDASSYALADFRVFSDDNEKIKKTIKEIEKTLWHKKLGGICRYKKIIGRNNGGYGPWPHFTLMICRHFIRLGNKKKADKYLNWILKIAYKNKLPEHVALKKDFEEWVKNYKKAGLLRKDRKIMIKNIRKHKLYKKGLAYSVLPLAWPHAEFIITWILYKEKFLNE